jgi:hypothetical protein
MRATDQPGTGAGTDSVIMKLLLLHDHQESPAFPAIMA